MGTGLPFRSIEQPLKHSTPQVNSYQQREVDVGRITSRFEGGPAQISAFGGSGGGNGLSGLAAGLGRWRDVLEKQEQQQQNLDALAKMQAFRDQERIMLDQVSEMEGADGFDAPAYADNFYAKSGEKLVNSAKGDFQRGIYEQFLSGERNKGLNTAFAHRSRELDSWEASVWAGEEAILFEELDASPTNWQAVEARGMAIIDAANPGKDNTAKKVAFKKQLAKSGVEAAIAQGDPATAQQMINKLGSSADKAELQATFAAAESKARVRAGTQAGLQKGQAGESFEFYTQTVEDMATGKLDPKEGQEILQNVKSVEETGRQQRKAQQAENEEAAKAELLQAKAENRATPEMILNDPRLPADYKDRQIKELTDTSKPSLDSAGGRDIDFKIKMAIDSGQVNDLPTLFDTVTTLDPDGKYVSAASLNSYETRLKEAGKADDTGNPKINYFNEALSAVGKRSEFQGKTPDKKAEGALKLSRLKESVYRELEMQGISVHDQAAGQAVLKAAEKEIVTKPGFIFDTKERWYELSPEQRPPLFNRPESQPRGGVGGVLGGGMAAAGSIGSLALDMAERGEGHWLTDYEENTDAALAQLIEGQTKAQGLPLTSYTRDWVSEGLMEQRSAREVTPSFARVWPGQGLVTVDNLGQVNDYNGLIERYATSYGIDPNLIAAMMYAESRGNRYAVSSEGAQGLMQFMPATAQRFGITDRTDPAQSIRGSCQYMRWLLDRYDGNVAKAVGAYNAGEGSIDKGRYPKETRNYIPKVLSIWKSAGNGSQMQSPGQINSTAGSNGFVSPLSNMLVTSKFGPRNTGIVGASTNHKGIDLRAPIGTPVGSIADGVIEAAAYKGKNGNYVVVNHGNGRKSYYLHLDGFSKGLQPGTRVKAGQVIGRSGNSGDFKKPLAPHLDFRISENGTFVDPSRFFADLQYKKGA